MANALMDLFQSLINSIYPPEQKSKSAQPPTPAPDANIHYPIYSENRRTHAPMYTDQSTKPASTGLTLPPDLNTPPSTGLNVADRARLFMAGVQNGVGSDMSNYLLSKAGTENGGAMYIHQGTDPTDSLNNTIRHETVHSLLDQNEIKSKQLQGFMDSHPELAPVAHAFNQAPANGDSATELPAYMAQPAPGFYNPTPEHRAAYLKAFVPWLNKQDPKVAQQYQSLVSQ